MYIHLLGLVQGCSLWKEATRSAALDERTECAMPIETMRDSIFRLRNSTIDFENFIVLIHESDLDPGNRPLAIEDDV